MSSARNEVLADDPSPDELAPSDPRPLVEAGLTEHGKQVVLRLETERSLALAHLKLCGSDAAMGVIAIAARAAASPRRDGLTPDTVAHAVIGQAVADLQSFVAAFTENGAADEIARSIASQTATAPTGGHRR